MSPSPPRDADLIRTPGGAFRREPAILPRMLDELFPRREAAKKMRDDVASHAIKILMNSFYGVLGTSACRFYNPALANSITGMGREILLWSKRWFETAGFAGAVRRHRQFVRCIAGRRSGPNARTGRRLAAALNDELARHIGERWRRAEPPGTQVREAVPETVSAARAPQHARRQQTLRRACAMAARRRSRVRRHGGRAPRLDCARQAGSARTLSAPVHRPGGRCLPRGDREARAHGDLDEALVYRKNLRKDADEYTATTPPHVVAARKSTQPPGRLVSYVITTAGPEPLDNVQHPLDREHYVLKQVKPVAEPVLETLGLDFERVIGDSRQIDLYSMLR